MVFGCRGEAPHPKAPVCLSLCIELLLVFWGLAEGFVELCLAWAACAGHRHNAGTRCWQRSEPNPAGSQTFPRGVRGEC